MNMQLTPVAPPVFLGIESGGTRSVAILADAHAKCVRRLEHDEPANLRLLNDAQLLRLFQTIGVQLPRPTALGIGMAGVLEEAERARVREAAARVWPDIPCWAGNDLETALAAVNNGNDKRQPVRVIVISGTGASCYGRGVDGKEVLTGGWGHSLGDRGSGYDIALRAFQAVFRELDRSGSWPALGRRLVTPLGLDSPLDAVGRVGALTKAEMAALAVVVFESAATGDKLAKRILAEAAEAIACTASACARRLVRAKRPLEFVLTGSTLVKQPRFARQVKRRLLLAWPRATVKTIAREGAWGAVFLAQQHGVGEKTATLSETALPRQKPGSPSESPATIAQSDPAAQFPVSSQISPAIRGIRVIRGQIQFPVSLGISPTEQRNPKSKRLSKLSVRAAVRLMLREELLVPAALLREEKKIARGVELIARSFRRGGRLIYVGAGTSGRLGLLDAHECPPTFGVAPEMVQAILAGGEQAMRGSFEGAEDDAEAGAQAVRFRGVSEKDVVVGIAASGRTPFVWGALHTAKAFGARTILICFNPNLRFSPANRPTLVLAPRIGPEVLTGSTRLKAGTATKLLLNTFSTLAMVCMGRVVENLMVGVQASNSKLRQRALRIVQELTGATCEAAEEALRRSEWSPRQALARLQRTGAAAGSA
jgi:N-acetylmuramic acid 6-phosphate etherase